MLTVIHKKTGNKYYIIQENIIDATNSRDGETVILYENEQGMKFVRETNEFWNKFKLGE